MRKIPFLLIGLLIIFSCGNQKKEDINIEKTKLGNDRDDHDCIASAGFIFSNLKQDCIRIFEVGKQLLPVDTPSAEPTLSAYIVFNTDKSKLELFLPGESAAILLNQSEKGIYSKANFNFDANNGKLTIAGKVLYAANK